MVDETVQQGSGQSFRAEDLRPLVESQVGGHHDGAPLVALAEYLEEQLGPGLGQEDESWFIDDQQIRPGKLTLQVEQTGLIRRSWGPPETSFSGRPETLSTRDKSNYRAW